MPHYRGMCIILWNTPLFTRGMCVKPKFKLQFDLHAPVSAHVYHFWTLYETYFDTHELMVGYVLYYRISKLYNTRKDISLCLATLMFYELGLHSKHCRSILTKQWRQVTWHFSCPTIAALSKSIYNVCSVSPIHKTRALPNTRKYFFEYSIVLKYGNDRYAPPSAHVY